MIFRTKLDKPATRNTAGSRRGICDTSQCEPLGGRRHCAYKATGGSPLLEHLYPLALACVPSVSLSQSAHSLVWIGDLISMASTYCQPITHSYPYAFTVESGFQSSKPLTSSDISRLGCAARFNLSAMDLPVSMNDRFQMPSAASQLLPSARTADLSKDRNLWFRRRR